MGNTRSFCVSLSSCERNIVSSTQINQTFIYEEKNTIAKESFKMSTEDLKLSHQDFRRFLLTKLKKKCIENPDAQEYYEFYKSTTKDRVAFESIYWLFSIRWIEYVQSLNNSSRGRMFETAISFVSQTSQHNLVENKFNSNQFLKFIVEEICTNNYKITQILEKFRITFFLKNKNLLQNEEFFQNFEENDLAALTNKIIKELEDFLFDPLKDFIVFFYSTALEKIVYHYLGQSSQFFNLFLVDIIHHLVFKIQNKIYYLISRIFSLNSQKESSILQKNMSENDKFSLVSLLENQDFLFSNEILAKIEDKSFFENACLKVRSISDVRTPLLKLELIGQIHQEIMNSLQQINEQYNLNYNMEKIWKKFDADQMISLYCYVLVKSNHYEIFKEIKFIEKFIGRSVEETQWEYFYENLRSSVEYILTFG